MYVCLWSLTSNTELATARENMLRKWPQFQLHTDRHGDTHVKNVASNKLSVKECDRGQHIYYEHTYKMTAAACVCDEVSGCSNDDTVTTHTSMIIMVITLKA